MLIPVWLHEICFRVSEEWYKLDNTHRILPDHVTINEYHKGQSIDWHIDSKGSGPIITVLSLESDATMGLKWIPEGQSDERSEIVKLSTRSLLHMTEKDRWKKEHCIYPVDDHRWSLVFRKGTE